MSPDDTAGTRGEALAAVTRTSRDLAVHVTPDGIHADRLAGVEHPITTMLAAYSEALHDAEQSGIEPSDVEAAIRRGIDTAEHQRRLETATLALHNAFSTGQPRDITDLIRDYGAAEEAAAVAKIPSHDVGTIIETVLDPRNDTTRRTDESPVTQLPTAADEARRLAALSQPTTPHAALGRNGAAQRTAPRRDTTRPEPKHRPHTVIPSRTGNSPREPTSLQSLAFPAPSQVPSSAVAGCSRYRNAVGTASWHGALTGNRCVAFNPP